MKLPIETSKVYIDQGLSKYQQQQVADLIEKRVREHEQQAQVYGYFLFTMFCFALFIVWLAK